MLSRLSQWHITSADMEHVKWPNARAWLRGINPLVIVTISANPVVGCDRVEDDHRADSSGVVTSCR